MGNQSNKDSKKFQIPMIVTDEDIRDFRIKKEDVTWKHLGNRKYRVVMVDAKEEEYKAYIEPIWAEIKHKDRDGRYMIKGKNGKLICCPESNRCEKCAHLSRSYCQRNATASLSFLKYLVAMLARVKPKCGRIFRLIYWCATKQEMSNELQKDTARRRNVLVAMKFGEETKALREAIRQGIHDAKYNAVFIDEVHYNGFITPELLKNIRDSKFVVVDLTHQNNGAYFEEGYAMGLGKQVIQLCKKDTKLHFDIAQKNTIMWEKEDDIPEMLKNRIKATID